MRADQLCNKCGVPLYKHPNNECLAEMIMVHLNHPCREIDVWQCDTLDERKIAMAQGYISLRTIRERVIEAYEKLHGEKWDAGIAP